MRFFQSNDYLWEVPLLSLLPSVLLYWITHPNCRKRCRETQICCQLLATVKVSLEPVSKIEEVTSGGS